MRGRQGLIADHEGTLYVIEAIVGAILMLSCVACLSAIPHQSPRENNDDLSVMSADLLYILEYRDNRPGHPGLAQALSSPEAWAEQSKAIESDVYALLLPGVKACIETPYGEAGDYPPDGAVMYVMPFLGFRPDTCKAIDCKLILWRG